MKAFILPITLISSSFLFSACQEASQLQDAANQVAQAAEQVNEKVQDVNNQVQQETEALKSGNILPFMKDINALKSQVDSHFTEIQDSKAMLEQALNNQDSVQFAESIQQLNDQINDLNGVLADLDLQSQDVDQIRDKILQANEKVLASPLLQGKLELQQVDVSSLEKQFGSVETEMLKLAQMLISIEKTES